MSYKRVVKKKGKSYGPYIYESYRDENGKVKKRYLGKAIEPKKNIVSLKFLVGFLGVLFLIGAGYTTNYFVENWKDDVKFKDFVTGFIVEEETVEGIGEEAKEKAETAKEEAGAVTGAAKESSGSGGPSTATEKVVPEGVFGDMNGAEVDLSVAESGEEITGNETTTEDIENETTDGIEAITGNETTNDTEDAIFPDIPTIDVNETLVNETNETFDFNETAENLTFVNETTTLENLTDTNITIEDLNITNVTVLNETLLNETNETVSNISIENITTLQYKAVIGRPVKWIKKINVTNISSGLNIELPSGAENISILTDEEIVIAESEIEEYEDLIEAIGREEIAAGLLTGDVVYDLKSNGGFITRFWNFIKSFGITGNVILIEEDSEKITRTENSTVINLNLTEIIVGETEIALEYYTEAPVANETKTPVGKRIIVHAPDELNYTEILAYTLVDEYNISMNRSDIALYWYAPLEDVSSEDILEDILGIVEEVTLLDSINDSFIDEISLERLNISDGENVTGVIEEVAGGENSSDDEIVVGEDIGSNEIDESFNILLTGQVVLDDLDGGDFFDETLEGEVALRLSGDKSGLIKKRIEFVSYDFDGDGIMDYIEWIVPHLSAQTYEFVVTDVSDEKIFLYEDVVPENNFTHLNISDVSPYDSLMLYLPFDTNTSANIAYDYTENNNDMNIYNGSEFVSAGKIGGAFNFDGVDDIGIINNTPELGNMTTNFSIALWVKTGFNSSTPLNHVPIDKFDSNGGWKFLFRQNTDVFSFRFRNSGVNQQCEVTNAMTFSAGTWIHLVGTWNGTHSVIYLDGVMNNTCLLSGPMSVSENPINIGQSFTFAAWWNGSIDEVMLFNSTLSASQIADIYNNVSARYKTQGTQTLKFQNIPTGLTELNITSNFQNEKGSNISLRVGEWELTKGYNESDNGLVSYYHADSHANDSKENYNGSFEGGAHANFGGVFENAFELDGVDSYIDIGNNSALNGTNVTFVSWVYWRGGNGSVVSQMNATGFGYSIYIDNTSATNANVSFGLDSTKAYYENLTINEWHLIVGTHNDTDLAIYVDGKLKNVSSKSGEGINTMAYIGFDNSTGDYLDSMIDEVMIYNRTLSESEIADLFFRARVNWNYGSAQNLSLTGNTFSLSADSSHILSEYSFIAGTSQFYGPIFYSIDNSGNPVNLTFNASGSFVNIIRDYPVTNLSLNNRSVFNVTLNITCTVVDCNNLNTTLELDVRGFVRVVGDDDVEIATRLIQTNDNGYVITGYTQSYGGSDADIILVKFDENGTELWTKIIDGSTHDIAYDIIETVDNDLVITGYTQSYGGSDADIILVKFDENGTELWTSHIGGSFSDKGRGITETSDGGYVVASGSTSFGGTTEDLALSKFYSNGTEQWTVVMQQAQVDRAYDVIEASNGDLVLVGTTAGYSTAGNDDIVIIRFYENGTIIYLKALDFNNDDTVHSIKEAANDDLIIVGVGNSGDDNAFLSRLYSNGTFQWTRSLSESGDEFGYGVVVAANGDLVVTGKTKSFGGGDDDIFVTRFDENGTQLWTRIIGGTGSDVANDIIENNDGDLVLTGYTTSYGGSDIDIILIKMSSDGQLVFDDISEVNFSGSLDNNDGTDNTEAEVTETQTETSETIFETDINATVIELLSDIVLNSTSSTFFINTTNPNSTTLNVGESEVITWYLNASGIENKTYFINYYSSILGNIVSNIGTFNVTILGSPNITIIGPASNFTVQKTRNINVNLNLTCGLYDCATFNTTLLLDARGFVRAIGEGGFNDVYNSVINTSDGGYLVVGRSREFGSGGDWDIILLKFYSNGTEQWTKSLGSTSLDWGYDVIETSDDRLAVTGYSAGWGGGDNDPFISKFYSNGTEIWTNTLNGTADERSFALVETNDNGLVITGHRGVSLLLSKFYSNGTENWTKTLGARLGNDVIETTDGGLVVTGTGVTASNILLSRFYSNGTEQWSVIVNGSGVGTDTGNAVIETSNGDLVVIGETENYGGSDKDVILIRYFSNGTEKWTKTLGGDLDDYGYDVIETNDGNLVITGITKSYGGSDEDILLSKFDENGTEIWSIVFGGSENDEAFSLIEDVDKNLIITGTTRSYNDAGGTDGFLLVKFDSNGYILSDDWTNLSISEEDQNVTEYILNLDENDENYINESISVTEIDETVTFNETVEDIIINSTTSYFTVTKDNPNSTSLNGGETLNITWDPKAIGNGTKLYYFKYYSEISGDLISEIGTFNVKIIADDVDPIVTFINPTPVDGYVSATDNISVNLSVIDNAWYYSFTDMDNSLLGLWGAEDGPNSTFGNNGTFAGDAAVVDNGQFGKGFNFDGDGDYINVVNSNDIVFGTNNFTISVWFKSVDPNPIYPSMIGKGDTSSGEWMFRIGSADKLNFYADAGAYDITNHDAIVIDDDLWHHGVVTRAGNTTSVYLDGGTPATSVGNIVDLTTSKDIQIGASDSSSNRWWNGSLDEVMIFNRSLSYAEILSLYNSTANNFDNNFEGLSEGIHNFTGYAVDSFGNKGSTVTTYFVSTPGSIILNSPTDGKLISENGTVLNSTINSVNPNETLFYVSTSNTFTKHNIVGRTNGSTFGETVTLNFIAIPANTTTSPLLLLHFDNLSSELSNYSSGGLINNYGSESVSVIINETNTPKFNYSNEVMAGSFNFTTGSNESISITGLPAINSSDDFSISAWVRNDEVVSGTYWDDLHTIFGGEFGNTTAFVINGGNLSLNLDDASINGSVTLEVGKWYHVVATYNGSDNNASLYVDGVLDNYGITSDGDGFGSVNTWYIGYQGIDYSSDTSINHHLNFNGSIDEVLFWNRTLNASEIGSLHVRGAGVYYWKVNNSWTTSSVRTFKIDGDFPGIDFVSPTPETNNVRNRQDLIVNLSVTEINDHYSFVDFDNSLTGYWRAEDGANATIGNNGTFFGDAKVIDDGRFGKGFYFDGNSDLVRIDAPDLNYTTNFSYGAWVKADKLGTVEGVISRQHAPFPQGYALHFGTDANVNISCDLGAFVNDNAISSTVPVVDTWYHAMCVHNGTRMNLYVNGVLQINYTETTVGVSANDYLRIGTLNNFQFAGFNGTIDEVMIFNRTLSTDEVLSLYNSTANSYDHNFTGVSEGVHNYTGYVVDAVGNLNTTETRNAIIDLTLPFIEFNGSTPANGSFQTDDWFVVEMNTSDLNDHYSFVDFDNSLTGYWRAEDGANAIKGNNGTLLGDAKVIDDGRFGKGFYFDGNSDLVRIDAPDLNYTTNFSYGAWVKADKLGTVEGVISRQHAPFPQGYALHFGTDANVNISCDLGAFVNDNAISSTVPVVDTWYHAMCVHNGTRMNLYVNGVLQINYTETTVGVSANDYLRIGTLNNFQFAGFNGTIDEVMIFNRSLSSAEVLSLYDSAVNSYSNNFSELQNKEYNFTGYAVDEGGNLNTTETREVQVGPVGISSCTTLDREGFTYQLTSNVTASANSCFIIGADDITFNLKEYTVIGDRTNGKYGVGSESVNGSMTLLNGTIDNFDIGIQALWINSNVYNVSIENNGRGIYLYASTSNNTFDSINISNSSLYDIYSDNMQLARLLNINISLTNASKNLFIQGMTDSLFENITIDSNSDYVIDLGADSSNISSNVTFKDINITGFSNISIFINNSEEINFSRINITGANLDYLLYNSTIYNYDFSENSLVINNSYGAVEFINSSLVASGSNLSEVIQITDNNVFINSTKDIGFNTTANITLNDLITPVVAESIVDYFDNGTFVDCPANLCMDISWDNVTNVYKFNVTHFTTYSSEEFNTIPNTPQPFLNTSSGANISSENLICDILIDDPDGDALNVTVNWYLNDSFNLSVNYSSQTNGTNLLAILESGNTTRYENWTCEARFTDEQDTTPYANSSSLSVLNQLPVITLLSPANVSSTINRTPEFNWSVVDADSDVSHYQINITDYKFSGSQICSDSLLELLTGTSFVPTVDLLCLHDNGYYYTWRVRANDSVGFGAWSEDFIVNITADTTITLVTDSMNFGLLAPSGSNDTTNENPSPFVIRNDGTVMTNISINASALWTTQSENSSSFQFKVDNVSSEPNSFNWINSIIQFFNVPITGDVVAISELNYTDSSDSAEIDISILVPSNEGPGAKSSTIIFTSRLAEIG